MKKLWVIGVLFIVFGCDSKSSSQEKLQKTTSNDKVAKLEAVYDGPLNSSEFSHVYNTSCGSNECIIEVTPEAAPLKKSTKENLCIIPSHERSAIVTAYFSREDTVEGALCEVSKADYETLIASYGKSSVYKKYLNQRSSEDFLTWKEKNGYVTTYKEILGRDPNGNVMYNYYVYIGSVEHRHYSKYVAN